MNSRLTRNLYMIQLNTISIDIAPNIFHREESVDQLSVNVLPPSMRLRSRIFNTMLRYVAWIVIRLTFINFKVNNSKIIPKKGPLIIVGADHTSLADALFVIASIRCTYAGIGMAELKNTDEWPWIIGKSFDLLGHIPIDRGNSDSGDSAFASGLNVLSHNQALVVWPQGRQVHRDSNQPWYPGFARFAKETGANIYVFKIEGADDFWPTNPGDGGPQKIHWRAKVRASFSGPIDPNDFVSVEELIAATRLVHAGLPLPS